MVSVGIDAKAANFPVGVVENGEMCHPLSWPSQLPSHRDREVPLSAPHPKVHQSARIKRTDLVAKTTLSGLPQSATGVRVSFVNSDREQGLFVFVCRLFARVGGLFANSPVREHFVCFLFVKPAFPRERQRPRLRVPIAVLPVPRGPASGALPSSS